MLLPERVIAMITRTLGLFYFKKALLFVIPSKPCKLLCVGMDTLSYAFNHCKFIQIFVHIADVFIKSLFADFKIVKITERACIPGIKASVFVLLALFKTRDKEHWGFVFVF